MSHPLLRRFCHLAFGHQAECHVLDSKAPSKRYRFDNRLGQHGQKYIQPTLGLLFTILHVILHCCCNRPLPSCWQSTCCNFPEVEYGALVCSDLNKPHILDADGKPKPVLNHEEEDMQGIELVVTELVERLTDQAAGESQEVTKYCLSEFNEKRSI